MDGWESQSWWLRGSKESLLAILCAVWEDNNRSMKAWKIWCDYNRNLYALIIHSFWPHDLNVWMEVDEGEKFKYLG